MARSNSMTWVAMVCGLAWAGAGRQAQAQVIYVDEDATGANNGSSWANAYARLQDALAAASSGEIWVAEGVYKPDQGTGITPGDRTATLQLKNNVAILGGFSGTEILADQRNPSVNLTVLSGDLAGNDNLGDFPTGATLGENSFHVVTSSGTNSTAILDGFTITAGRANGGPSNDIAAGMFNLGGSPTLRHCTFARNSAFASGAVINSAGSSARFEECIFDENFAPQAGAMSNFSGSNVRLTDCTFSNNTAQSGGVRDTSGGVFEGMIAMGSAMDGSPG